VDSFATGSIDPSAASGFARTSEMPPIAQAFTALEPGEAAAPGDVTLVPDAIASPVKVEMPPDTLGPMELRQAAADGDARAQFEIGAIYTEGRAVAQDFALAATWYERAAAQGFAPAQYRLGNLYENGRGVEKDLEQARLWYQRAAEAGNRMSMHNLAALYAGGLLGKQEFASAAEWFEKAATEGLTDSQFNLGMLYARGLGVTQDLEASYKWFALAARSGDKDAGKARDDIAKSLDSTTVNRLAAEVAAWTPAAIDLAANFAPIGTWSPKFDPGEVIKTREVVLGVQTLLTRLGYDVGTPDGMAGPKTAEAIKSFERATGMSESGSVNPRLLAVLGSQPV
jgi:localization factor PodJL